MPKVLNIINRFNIGGQIYSAVYLTKYLRPEFETLLIGGQKDDTEDSSEFIARDIGIKPIIIPEMRRKINPKNDYLAYKRIVKIIKDFKPDIVHTHASKAGMLGRKAAFNCKVPVILHTFHGHVFHSYFNTYKSKFFQKIEQNLAKKTTGIIALSQQQKHELSTIYKIAPQSKVRVIPLGFDLDKFQTDVEAKRKQFRTDYNVSGEEIAIGIIGRLVPIKNHDLFLHSINKIIHKTNKKIRIFIVGDGENRELLIQKAKELKLDFVQNGESKKRKATITFTSWITNIDYVYSGLDVVALTSLNEGTPVSLIEAQASNTPIVSTNVGGIENIVIPNETALLSRNGNLDEFAEKLLTIIEDDALRTRLSKKGWQYAKENYHYSNFIENTKKFYYDLLNNI